MNYQDSLLIYQAQVENTRSLTSAIKQIRRTINEAYRSRDDACVQAQTKIYALLFCAWAEANFSKLIHTPHGFEIDEIEQIKRELKISVAGAWKKSVDLGLRHLDAKRGNFRPNAKQKLFRTIDSFVISPNMIRNKLAHGQWRKALNRENTALNHDMTVAIASLNIVSIDNLMRSHQLLAEMIENLIESPVKVFQNDWFAKVTALEEALVVAQKRTLVEHKKRLRAKRVTRIPD